MIFGSAEHFDYIYSKIRHDDYVCDFYYNVLDKRIEITFIPKEFKNVRSMAFITRQMWDDSFYRNYWLNMTKENFLKSLKQFKESRHLQITSEPNVPVKAS